MRYVHSMVRVRNLEESIHFFCDLLGLVEIERDDDEEDRYTIVFLAAPKDVDQVKADESPALELTYNWDVEDYGSARNFGHLAYHVDDIYGLCQRLMDGGVTINRPPRDGHMAFVRTPDDISLELIQEGDPLPPTEPWLSMPNNGSW